MRSLGSECWQCWGSSVCVAGRGKAALRGSIISVALCVEGLGRTWSCNMATIMVMMVVTVMCQVSSTQLCQVSKPLLPTPRHQRSLSALSSYQHIIRGQPELFIAWIWEPSVPRDFAYLSSCYGSTWINASWIFRWQSLPLLRESVVKFSEQNSGKMVDTSKLINSVQFHQYRWQLWHIPWFFFIPSKFKLVDNWLPDWKWIDWYICSGSPW